MIKKKFMDCQILSKDNVHYIYFKEIDELAQLPATFKVGYHLDSTIKQLKKLGYKCKGYEYLRNGNPDYELKIMVHI